MSIKHAAGRIPAGGGKGGIAADPDKLSKLEFERLCRAYIRYLRPSGPDCDVPGADVGTGMQSMSWMLDEYEQITGRHSPAAVNDKPPILGGTLGGYEATGLGVFEVFQAAAEQIDFKLEGARIAIQGFGQVGSVAAQAFQDAGCKVIAVREVDSGAYSEEGLDINALLEHRESEGSLENFPAPSQLPMRSFLPVTATCLYRQPCRGYHQGRCRKGKRANPRGSRQLADHSGRRRAVTGAWRHHRPGCAGKRRQCSPVPDGAHSGSVRRLLGFGNHQ